MKHRWMEKRAEEGGDYLEENFHDSISILDDTGLGGLCLAQLLHNHLQYSAQQTLRIPIHLNTHMDST